MKISLAWLQTHLVEPVSADAVETALINLGLPIETRMPVAGGDEMLDVEVTSNRPDCLSHRGLAREVAAAWQLTLKSLPCDLPAARVDATAAASLAQVQLHDDQACPVYTARVIRGVKVGPSPAWLVQRLEAIGLRSVNNVVDVTNFVLMELGQPLHAFDLARLSQSTIVVRPANNGETFAAIDGTKHTLKASMLVIADAARPMAVAGVMGGLDSEVTHATRNVLLESALFDPLSVRRTSRALRLKSDSSYRFERGIDPAGVELASRLAARMIVELAGGKVADGVIRVGAPEPAPQSVTLRPQRCRSVLGFDIAATEMVDLLARLDMAPKLGQSTGAAAQETITCTVPTYRLDIRKEIDLVEEVARLAGYDRLPIADKITIQVRPMQPDIAALRTIRQALTAQGYLETVNFSFIAPAKGTPFVPADRQPLLIDDDRRKKEPMLRPSLLPSLLLCRKGNHDLGNHDVRLFEIASTWVRKGPQRPHPSPLPKGEGDTIEETRRLGLLSDIPPGVALDVALRDLRGILADMLSQLSTAQVEFAPADGPVPGLQAVALVKLGGKTIGVCGAITPAIQSLFELQGATIAAEMELPPLLQDYPPQRQVEALPRFPGIERDLSAVVADSVTWAAIAGAIATVQPALLEEVRFVTTYRGKPIPAGSKSVTFRMVFRDPSATLRHEQVDPQVQAVVDRLTTQLQATWRK